MPRLQTCVEIPEPGFSINYRQNILLAGSCFAANIGEKLGKLKFRSLTNPFGVLYNPASIAQSLKLLLSGKSFIESDLYFHNQLWFSFYHHSSFSSADKVACLEQINLSLKAASEHLQTAGILFITLGTSWVYQYKKTGEIVSNCHKLPAQEFVREFLEPQQIAALLSEPFNKLLASNPGIQIVLTISPIRHWKDGAIENMRSKASLVMAMRELEKKYAGNLYYFPVYELFMDEMRDYRYYAADMLHPSDFAIEYVWEKFFGLFFDKNTRNQIADVEKLLSMLGHRPFNTASADYAKFCNRIKNHILLLKSRYPSIDLTEETKQFDN